MARDYIREVALTARATWTLRDGKVNIIGANARDTGSTVVLSAKTGLIGQPILRQEGLIARCRINPAIQLSTNVQIDAQIVRPKFNLGNDQTGSLNPATTADYDIYNGAGSVFRVLHMQTNGDTRGEDWSTELTLGVGNVLNAAQGAMHLDPNLGIGRTDDQWSAQRGRRPGEPVRPPVRGASGVMERVELTVARNGGSGGQLRTCPPPSSPEHLWKTGANSV